MDKLEECFEQKRSIDSLIHEKMMDLFRLYLIVGGMPAAVQRYLQTNNLNEVLQIQTGIIQLYKKILPNMIQMRSYILKIFSIDTK